jgi:KamA family protein
MTRIEYHNSLHDARCVPHSVRDSASVVTDRFRFRANEYYLGLINWSNPHDPIRRVIIPDMSELDEWGNLDPSAEHANYVAPRTQHKYHDTVLMLISDSCGGFCRYCFRKRIFIDNAEVTDNDLTAGIEYLKQNKQIRHVLLSGGDPMMLSTRRLGSIIAKIRAIDHIATIRVGTKMLAFNPYRILDDPDLPAMLGRYSTPEKRIWIIAHYNCVEEITQQSIMAVDMLLKQGLAISHQTPMLAGVNDSSHAIVALMNKLVSIGISPYYVFQCRPTSGNSSFAVPITRGYRILRNAGKQLSGLAKRGRFVMSHATGKIEIAGTDEQHIYLRYHRAKNEADDGKFIHFRRDDTACWLDDLTPVDHSLKVGKRSPLRDNSISGYSSDSTGSVN